MLTLTKLGAPSRNRTTIAGLQNRSISIILIEQIKQDSIFWLFFKKRFLMFAVAILNLVGMEGFEPSVSCSQSRRIKPDFPTLRINYWHPPRDSNSDERFWRPLCCHYIREIKLGAADGNRTRLSWIDNPVLSQRTTTAKTGRRIRDRT